MGWMFLTVALVSNVPRLLAFLDLWARTWGNSGAISSILKKFDRSQRVVLISSPFG